MSSILLPIESASSKGTRHLTYFYHADEKARADRAAASPSYIDGAVVPLYRRAPEPEPAPHWVFTPEQLDTVRRAMRRYAVHLNAHDAGPVFDLLRDALPEGAVLAVRLQPTPSTSANHD